MSSSLRALLLALVMVVQTIAGGLSVAHASPGGGELAMTGHCEPVVGDDGKATGGVPAGRHQHCDACCLCSGAHAVPLASGGAIFSRSLVFHITRFAARETRRVAPRLAQSQSARGPPAAVRA